MKKFIYLFLLLIIPPVSVFGQLSGGGTFLDPYTGTLNSTATWSGRTYFDVVNVAAGGSLTISPGATILAVNTTSSITISETGILNAVGNSGSLITFSADNNGNNTPEPGETWMNLLFDNSTGTSVIDYAVIENGTGDSFYSGGGIDITGNNITISNSTIRNCTTLGYGGGIAATPSGSNVTLQDLKLYGNSGGYGGGLFTDGNVTLTGCEIYNNYASSGAGVYFNGAGSISRSFIHDNSGGEGIYSFGSDANSSITNCVIYNNGVGIYFYGQRNVVNCTIVNNITGITSASVSTPVIVNSVLWGNSTQYSMEPGASIELAYCGIQGGFTVGTDGGGNKNINSSNPADTGPNFVNASTDFHINSWITPLVDGAAASFAGVTIPAADIEGKSRIGAIDIGAYEFLYYIWTGAASTTSWTTSGNWVGSPASIPTTISENKVYIPKGCSFYPTASVLTLSSRSILTIEPQAGLTVTGATTVNTGCTFYLKSDATGSANFITGSSTGLSGTGTFNVEMFLTGGGDPDFKWHYVTTPVAGIGKAVLTTNIGNTYNLLNYIESRVTTDKTTGWNWHDGYNGSSSFLTLLNNFGYNVYVSSDQTAVFTGNILRGTDFLNLNITCGNTDPNQNGWNLIGNPFTSAVDANMFTLGTRLVDKSIYFSRNNQYLSYNTSTHVGINGATNIVLPLQGFFVHSTYGSGRSVLIPAASRLYTTNTFYKKSLSVAGDQSGEKIQETIAFPYCKFNVSDGVSFTDESIIYFFADATSAFDGEYDAYKMLAENIARPQIYSVSDNIKLGINGLAFPDKITTVPLNLRIGISKDYTINVLNLENLSDCRVTLIDGTNRIDLKTNPSYTFSATAGTKSDMAIEFDMSLTTNTEVLTRDQTTLWYSNGSIFIKTDLAGFENNSNIVIYDVNGKTVFSKTNISLTKGETVEVPVNLDNGFFITKVFNKTLKLTKKIVISH